jgi:hypothetical protein
MVEKYATKKDRYKDVGIEEWNELKAEILREFRLSIQQDQAKIEWGSTIHEWDRGVLEWEYNRGKVKEGKEDGVGGYLEIRIKRRPCDPPEMAIEKWIAGYFNRRAGDKQKGEQGNVKRV